MHFLLCHDGTPEAESAARFAAPLAGSVGGRITLFGVAEKDQDAAKLEKTLTENAETLAALTDVRVDASVRTGEPTREILARTMLEEFDLVILGARRKAGSGEFWRSPRVYEILKAVAPPVLVVVGRRERLRRVLICAGGKRYIHPAIRVTLQLALPTGAEVTLLHVLPEPQVPTAAAPAVTTGALPPLPEDSQTPLGTGDEVADNLRADRAALVAAGVSASVRVRHGRLLHEIAEELREGDYDLVVTGTSLADGAVREYLLGDVTREIINRAGCPVLVVRSGPVGERRYLPTAIPVVRRSGLGQALRGLFRGGGGEGDTPPAGQS